MVYDKVPVGGVNGLGGVSTSVLTGRFDRGHFDEREVAGVLDRGLPIRHFSLVALRFFVMSRRVRSSSPFGECGRFLSRVRSVLLQYKVKRVCVMGPCRYFLLVYLLASYPLTMFSRV